MTETSTDTTATSTPDSAAVDQPLDRERRDLLAALAQHRWFLRFTAQGLTDDQAAHRSTVSALTVGGLVKHVALTEQAWVDFVLEGPSALSDGENFDVDGRLAEFQMREGDTIEGLLARYDEIAARTDRLVAELPTLDVSHPLPSAPWFEPGAEWSARRVFLHVIAETAQHAGHADIVREAIDGQRTMG